MTFGHFEKIAHENNFLHSSIQDLKNNIMKKIENIDKIESL